MQEKKSSVKSTDMYELIKGASPQEILKTVFGFEDFRGDQANIVSDIIAGKNTLVLMPTGGGKSLCFQIPALALSGVTIVISPLIALMQDQVERLKQLGVRAETLNSEIDLEVQREIEAKMIKGEITLVYVSPERLSTISFQRLLEKVPVSLFAIDEAHCVSQWGHDFRKEYLQIGSFCDRFPHVPRMGLTGTADRRTEVDMVERLGLKSGKIYRASFDRPNISYTAVYKTSPATKQLLNYLEPRRGNSGIIYCTTVKEVESIAELVKQNGYDVIAYHAGMAPADKKKNLRRFTHSEGIIAVATIAFGMGIDKPDVRFVVHNGLPSNLEAYYQETGRAGRDGLPAEGFLMYGERDIMMRRMMMQNNSFASEEHKFSQRQKFDALLGYVESAQCRRKTVMNYFGEQHAGGCNNCDRCLRPVDTYNASRDAQIVLSAIRRTGERFGAAHIIDIISGTRSETVLQRKHDQLKTFGVGSHLMREQWKYVIRQMNASRLLDQPVEVKNGIIMPCGYEITDKGMSVMKGEQSIYLIDPPSKPTMLKNNRPMAVASSLSDDLPAANQELFAALKKWRIDQAKAQGVPPYVIMHDATFHKIAGSLPRSTSQLKPIQGMGASKIARYGDDVLSLVEAYCPHKPAPAKIGVPGFN